MAVYYNEIERFAAQWLRELIKRNLIAPGDVDERSIEDVTPSELKGYTQCHFFAGIGGWSLALRQAGWADDRPVWTGSCPCQPFSAAGKGKGFTDERHLWPAFHWLIQQCRPDTIFGEQVAGKAGETWFDLVSTDLESESYAIGSAVTAACGFGAPHQRKRLYWMADANSRKQQRFPVLQRDERNRENARREKTGRSTPSRSKIERVADTNNPGSQRRNFRWNGTVEQSAWAGDLVSERRNPTDSHWKDTDWLGCRDGKWRPVEPGTFPLANGIPARVGRLRGYGNAIVVPQAQAFIEAVM